MPNKGFIYLFIYLISYSIQLNNALLLQTSPDTLPFIIVHNNGTGQAEHHRGTVEIGV